MKNEAQMQVVEINGVKLEVDLRHAKVIDTYKVGDKVKVLVKDYGSSFKSCAGVIVGFDAFQKLPTIIVVYLEISYNEAKLRTAYFNANTEDVELCKATDDEIPFERSSVINMLDRDIVKKERELEDARFVKEKFLGMFNQYFKDYEKVAAQVDEAVME